MSYNDQYQDRRPPARMTEAPRRTAGASRVRPRTSLARTVLRIAVVAVVAATLVWSVLFVELLHKHGEANAATATGASGQQSSSNARGQESSSNADGQRSSSDGSQSTQTPAPLTTRTS